MGFELDAVDRQIIVLLQEDGRMSASEISRRIGGLTDRAVRNRIDRLVRSGVVYIGAIVNAAALGLPVTSDVIVEVAPWKLKEVALSLSDFREVGYLAVGPRTGQLSLQVHAGDECEVHSFVRNVVARQDGIVRITTVVTPDVVKGLTGFPQQPFSARRSIDARRSL